MISFKNFRVDKIALSDADGIFKMMNLNQKRFERYFPKTLELNRTTESSRIFVQNKIEQFNLKEEFLFVIKEGTAVIGLVYIKELDWSKKQGEFAYCIGSGHEGKGIMTKTIEALSSYAFLELDLEILQIIVHKDNPPSVKVAERCNFVWQKTLLKEFTPSNEVPLDMELYELYNER